MKNITFTCDLTDKNITDESFYIIQKVRWNGSYLEDIGSGDPLHLSAEAYETVTKFMERWNENKCMD